MGRERAALQAPFHDSVLEHYRAGNDGLGDKSARQRGTSGRCKGLLGGALCTGEGRDSGRSETEGWLVFDKLNKIPGVQCMPIEGAMYAFPQIDLPSKFVAHAESKGKKPDTLYALELLENLGVIAVPGNGFGQRAGTFHLRLTILPQEEELVRVLEGFERFHLDIYEEFGWPEGVARTEL